MSDFNPEEYWKLVHMKKWKITLVRRQGKKQEFDNKIVSASTREKAILTARMNTMMKSPIGVLECRLATPTDLGCVPSDSCVWCRGYGKDYSVRARTYVECAKCGGSGKKAVVVA